MSVLRHRSLRLLVGGQLASNVGDAVWAVALPWYVLHSHGGALLLATVLAAYGIPRAALLAVSGWAADRWSPWTVMLVADVTRMAAVGTIAGVAAVGPARAALLVPMAAVTGAGEGLFLPGSYAVIPALVPDADLQRSNAVSSSGTQVSALAGPALGGLLVAAVGADAGFAVDALTFAVSAASLLALRRIQAATVGREGAAEVPVEATRTGGLRQLVAGSPVLLVLFGVIVAANLGSGGMSEVALPALAHGPLRTGAGGYGLLLAAFDGGALIGTVLAGCADGFARPILVASLAFLVEAVAVALVPYLDGPWGAAGGLAVFGLCNGFGNVLSITAMQRWARPDVRGRLMGAVLLCSFGVFPLSVVAGGLVVHQLGPAAFFPMTGGVLAVAIVGGLCTRAWRDFGAPQATEDLAALPV